MLNAAAEKLEHDLGLIYGLKRKTIIDCWKSITIVPKAVNWSGLSGILAYILLENMIHVGVKIKPGYEHSYTRPDYISYYFQ